MYRSRLAALLGLLFIPLAASALDIVVTKTTDSLDGVCNTDCSLREAVVLANATPGVHRIQLGNGTYRLSLPTPIDPIYGSFILEEDANQNGDLDIASELEIAGLGSDRTQIDGNRNDRLFEVLSGAKLSLRRLALFNGVASVSGGGVENNGDLRLHQVRMHDNLVSYMLADGRGGAIANLGTLAVYSSQFDHNTAHLLDNAYGGALFNADTLLVRDSLFQSNVTKTRSQDTVGVGGALFNIGTADVARSAFLGGHWADGPGSAIRNDGNGALKLTNITVSGQGNGTSEFYVAAVVANGDSQSRYPGTPSMLLINVTIAGGSMLGLLNHGNLTIRNSLIAGNGPDFDENGNGGPQNCRNEGAFTYQARGLLLGSDPYNCTAELYVPDVLTFSQVLDPSLSAATLWTYPLRPGSLALDAGIGSCTSHDQRRAPRPQDGDGDGIAVCDLGAYERTGP